jgi:hypothetical protein
MQIDHQDFLDFVKRECKKHGVSVKITKGNYIRTIENGKAFHCSGYFDAESRVLAAASGHAMFLEVLAHEYCHLTQWVEQCKAWTDQETEDSMGKVWAWIAGKNVRNVDRHLNRATMLELDNEKRTVKIIKKFKLPIDIDTYVQKSNAYVLYYQHMKYTRKWCNRKNSPYKVPEIFENMSKKFNMKYNGMSKRVKIIYDKVYK